MNIIYFNTISKIGGIEEWLYQLGLKYHNLDITIYYKSADTKQLNRLKQYFRCIKYTNQLIKCEKAFFNFNLEIIDQVKAKEYILVLHGDYKDMISKGQVNAVPSHPKINRYVGVSQLVCDSYFEITGIKPELSYDPYTKPQTKKIYRFVLAQRFTKEKGVNRVRKLIDTLSDIDFTMDIFTNAPFECNNENVHFYKPRLDVSSLLTPKNYDFFVILSDNEGYCYGAVQALSNGLPVIATHLPVFDELGLNKTNSIWFEDFTLDKLNKKFNFNFLAPKDNWENIFENVETTYEGDIMVKIKVLKPFFDLQERKNHKEGDIIEADEERASFICEKGYAKKVEKKDVNK